MGYSKARHNGRPTVRASQTISRISQALPRSALSVQSFMRVGLHLRGQAAHAFRDGHGNPVPLCGDTERSTGAIDLADGLRLLLGQQRGDELDLLQVGQLQPGRLLQAMHHAIEQQHARHDGVAGKMPRQGRMIRRHAKTELNAAHRDFPFRSRSA